VTSEKSRTQSGHQKAREGMRDEGRVSRDEGQKVSREECRVKKMLSGETRGSSTEGRGEENRTFPSLLSAPCPVYFIRHSSLDPRHLSLGPFSQEQTEITEIFYENLSYLLLNMLQSPTLDPHGGLQRPRMKS
jgi:hypothetical protein